MSAFSSGDPVKCLAISLTSDLHVRLLIDEQLRPALVDYVGHLEFMACSNGFYRRPAFVASRLRKQTEEKRAQVEKLLKLTAPTEKAVDYLLTRLPQSSPEIDEFVDALKLAFFTDHDLEFVEERLAKDNLYTTISNTILSELLMKDRHHGQFFANLWTASRCTVVVFTSQGTINRQSKHHELCFQTIESNTNCNKRHFNIQQVKNGDGVSDVSYYWIQAPLVQLFWKRWWRFVKKEWKQRQRREPLNRHLVLVVDACHSGYLVGEIQRWAHFHRLFDLYKMQCSVTVQASCRESEKSRTCFFTPMWLRLNARLFPQSRDLLTDCTGDADKVQIPEPAEPAQHPCCVTLGSFQGDAFLRGRLKLVEHGDDKAKRFYQLWAVFCKHLINGEMRSRETSSSSS